MTNCERERMQKDKQGLKNSEKKTVFLNTIIIKRVNDFVNTIDHLKFYTTRNLFKKLFPLDSNILVSLKGDL